VHDLTAACRCVLSEAHIRANVNRGPRRLAVQEQSNGRTRRFSGTDGDAGRLLHLYRPQHAGYPRWDEDHGRPPGGPAKTPHFHPRYGACRRVNHIKWSPGNFTLPPDSAMNEGLPWRGTSKSTLILTPQTKS